VINNISFIYLWFNSCPKPGNAIDQSNFSILSLATLMTNSLSKFTKIALKHLFLCQTFMVRDLRGLFQPFVFSH
jgi:hypothetical protein